MCRWDVLLMGCLDDRARECVPSITRYGIEGLLGPRGLLSRPPPASGRSIGSKVTNDFAQFLKGGGVPEGYFQDRVGQVGYHLL